MSPRLTSRFVDVDSSEIEAVLLILIRGDLIGGVLGAFLYGIATVQTMLYFRKFRDPRPVQIIVIALNTIQLSFLINGILYLYQGVRSSQRSGSSQFHYYEVRQSTLCGALVIESGLVQSFFVSRIWILSKSWFPPLLAGACVASQVAVGVAWLIQWTYVGMMSSHGELFNLYTTWFSCTLISDVVIAAILSLLLWQRKTSVPSTDTLLNKLMMYTVLTGAATAVLGILALVAAVNISLSLLMVASSVHGSSYVVVILAK